MHRSCQGVDKLDVTLPDTDGQVGSNLNTIFLDGVITLRYKHWFYIKKKKKKDPTHNEKRHSRRYNGLDVFGLN